MSPPPSSLQRALIVRPAVAGFQALPYPSSRMMSEANLGASRVERHW